MKKSYEKPALVRRAKLPAITAAVNYSELILLPPGPVG